MKSALQEALSAIQEAVKRLNTQASNGGSKLMSYNIDKSKEDVSKFIQNIFNNPVAENRVSKKAIPIASLDDGGILYSDGTAKMPGYMNISPMERNELNIMRRNLLQQVPYTKEAQKLIKSATLGTFGLPYDMSSEQNIAGGYGGEWGGSVNRNAIQYGTGKSKYGDGSAMDILAHEMLHYFDNNVGKQTYVKKDENIANSMNFSKSLQKNAPRKYKSIINGPLSNTDLYDKNNRDTRDIEMFAYTGGPAGEKIYLQYPGEVSSAYAQVYQPMSKNINASPKYPFYDTMNKLDNMLPNNKQKSQQGPWEN